jgi:hypothetical protein
MSLAKSVETSHYIYRGGVRTQDNLFIHLKSEILTTRLLEKDKKKLVINVVMKWKIWKLKSPWYILFLVLRHWLLFC